MSCGERVSDCARRSATSRASLARSAQRRNPRGLSEKDGRPQIYFCRGAKLRCRHFWQAGRGTVEAEVTVMKNAENEDDEFEEHDGGSRPKPLASQNSTLPDLRRTEGVERGAVFKASRRVFVAFSSCAVLSYSVRSSPTMNIHSTGVCENGGAVLREMLSVFCCQQRFLVLFLPAKRCLHSTAQFDSTFTVFNVRGPIILTSRSFGAVFVNLLFDHWMHLLATAKVMCLKNCLCLLATGSFQGNSEKRRLFFCCQRRLW